MHHHHHDKACGCGHDHTEKAACGCGCGHDHHHDHEHTHDEPCGCGHDHAQLHTEGSELTNSQADVLLAIHQRGYLPVARFAVGSSKNEEAFAVALDPVYISNPKEDMETVKANGALFLSLEDMGLITLDYDLPLNGYAYEEYVTSDLYAYFLETVKEAAQKDGFAMDTPILELGSMALTEEGIQALKTLMDK